VQNHDQVGNRAAGERLAALVEPPALRLAAAILLLSPYVPLLFMGEEHGETAPFLYFVSHGDPELIAAVREGRRRGFAAFGWQGEVPDPQAEATFEASRPRWDRAEEGSGAALRALYRALLRSAARSRCSGPALTWWQARRPAECGAATDRGRRLRRSSTRVRPRTVPVAGPAELVLATDSPAYGGAGGARVAAGEVTLPGRSALVLRVPR
jgi:maltooligosyltrehalose trehalohydrolase